MKKLALVTVILIATCVVAMAQPRAIGGRLAYGVGVSYQHGFGEKNMLQLDIDFPAYSWGVQVAATYNWIFSIDSWTKPGSWNWYAGVGGGIGVDWWGTGWAGVAGMIGVEYNFKFPLQLSIDWRPVIGPWFNKDHAGFNGWGMYAGAVGIGVRYKF